MDTIEYDKTYAVYSSNNRQKASDIESNEDAQKTENLIHESGRMQLNTYQAFVQNLMNPRSDLRSLLLVHMTGTGKTITALATATEYVKQYNPHQEVNAVASVIVLGFTKEIFKQELLAHPEFTFVNADEAIALKKLESEMHKSDTIAEQYHAKKKLYNRRLVKREVKGIYQFYGYRQFASRIINTDDLNDMIRKTKKTEDTDFVDIDAKLIQKWISDGSVRINLSFIKSISHSLIICDEVHNLYKSESLNTYGLAIEVVFNYFYNDPKSPDYGCARALLLSATPLTTSAAEIIPIVNLLSGEKLEYKELFKSADGVDQLTTTGIAKIKTAIKGKVSYIMDDNPKEYPSSSFAGEQIQGINYLKFIRTAPIGHQLNYFNEWDSRAVNSSDDKGTNMCKDIILPSTPDHPHGITFSKHMALLSDLPQGKSVHRSANGLLTSAIFKLSALKDYSCKYAKMVEMCIDMKSKEHGKIFIYHPFVQGAGTDMIASILNANGFVMVGDVPDKYSLCMECNKLNGEHKSADHEFVPIVYTMINGNLSKLTASNRLAAFNNPANVFGEKIKIIIGSRAMRESHTLKACKHIMIMHEPSSISEMVQIIGRAVRKNVHAMLPEGMRTVLIHILTTNVSKNNNLKKDPVGNEEMSYLLKVLQFAQINRIERVMYDSAIDYLINFRFKLKETPPLLGEAYPLDTNAYSKYEKVLTKAYNDLRNGNSLQGIQTNRFNLFYLENECKLVIMIIKRILLDYQPMITIRKLMDRIRSPPFHIEYNTQLISDEAIAMAIQKITFTPDQMRMIISNKNESIVDRLYDQSSSVFNHNNELCKIVSIGNDLCLDTYLTIQSDKSILEGNKCIFDSFRKTFAITTDEPINTQTLLDTWALSINIDDIVDDIIKLFNNGIDKDSQKNNAMIESFVSKFPIRNHIMLVEWVIENATKHAIGKKKVKNIDIVKVIADYYRTTRLLLWVSDLETTRIYSRFKKYDKNTSTPWWSLQAKPSTAKLPIGHLLGDTVRILEPHDMAWLELGSIGVGIQDKHPMGWYIYEEQIGNSLEVASKIKFIKDKSSKGITLGFLQQTQLSEIAKQLKIKIDTKELKISIIQKIEEAAWAMQSKIYPKRVIYQLIDI